MWGGLMWGGLKTFIVILLIPLNLKLINNFFEFEGR